MVLLGQVFDDNWLLIAKRSDEHIYCVNHEKCLENGRAKTNSVCKKFKNRHWGQLAGFVTREFIINGGQKQ